VEQWLLRYPAAAAAAFLVNVSFPLGSGLVTQALSLIVTVSVR
jgi:hypothetical protein